MTMSVVASALMHIITLRGVHPNWLSVRKIKSAMPIETAIVVTVIVAVFANYAAALVQADYDTHHQPTTVKQRILAASP
jgi:hypothetical protein